MTSPYVGKKLRVTIKSGADTYILGVVEMMELEVLRDGKVEHYYHDNRKHSVGMKRVRFRVRRWFKSDQSDRTNLLYNLHLNNTTFDLSEFLKDITGTFVGLTLNDCVIYRYAEVTGSANDVVAEEASGEALVWEKKSG